MLKTVARVIERGAFIVPGTLSDRPRAIAALLRELASEIRTRGGDPIKVLEPDARFSLRLQTLLEVEISPFLNLNLSPRVEHVIT